MIHDFVLSCCDNRRSLREITDKLSTEPFGMRRGVIPFYLAYAFAQRKEDLIVYYSGKEIPLNSEILVNMCDYPDDYELFVSKEDIEKENYINSLRQEFNVEDTKNLTDSRIKDIFVCMQRWYRSLPQVARNLTKIELWIRRIDLSQSMQGEGHTKRHVRLVTLYLKLRVY